MTDPRAWLDAVDARTNAATDGPWKFQVSYVTRRDTYPVTGASWDGEGLHGLRNGRRQLAAPPLPDRHRHHDRFGGRMSTDDLVQRARALAAIDAPWTDRALVSELADEIEQRKAERDAARAALERVRGVAEDGDRLDGLWIYAPDLDRALEGES